MSDLSATRSGRSLIVRSARELSNATIPSLQKALGTQGNARLVILDLTGTEFADSAGLRWLLALRYSLDEQSAGLRVVAPRGRVRRALELSGYDRFLELYETSRAAWRVKPTRRRD